MIFDTMRAEPTESDNIGAVWLKHFGMRSSKSATFTAHAGQYNAGVICRAWQHKCEYLCGTWVEEGYGPMEYSHEIVAAWVPPEEYSALIAEADTPEITRRALQDIQDLRLGAWRELDD